MAKVAGVLLLGLLVSCGPDGRVSEGADDLDAAVEAGGAEGPIEGTPPGDLGTWVADVREVLEGLPGASVDRAVVQQQVLDMYVGRQEYVEMYYGPGGRLAGSAELGAAVTAAEERFHALMQLLGSSGPPSRARVEEARDALLAQYDVVLREAKRAGVPLDPRAASGQGASVAGSAEAGEAGLDAWLDSIGHGLSTVQAAAEAGDVAGARAAALRVYLDHVERVEAYYGPGGPHAAPDLAARVVEVERGFHELLRGEGEPSGLVDAAAALAGALDGIRRAARSAGVPLRPETPTFDTAAVGGTAETPEVSALLETLAEARTSYERGAREEALALVEAAYLDGFEPLEPRLPGGVAGRVERAIHIGLRPALAQATDPERVHAAFDAVRAGLMEADAALAKDRSFWFGAFNSFVIILREGLEAVLLVGALLAYLGATHAAAGHRRQIYAGVGLGIAASVATWGVARALIPIGGAGRELVEGITGLVAVAVLLYVSNWLFQNTYIHDWKSYLKGKAEAAMSTGSALAMGGLAFAAVYREGFETVLFYQALSFDAGSAAVLAGFLPGLILIVAVGVGIIRLGLRLPLTRVFRATNALLLYLAFTFVGKSLYNLQEAGLFAPHPVAWAPDSGILRQLFGIYPVAETLAAQAAFAVLVAGTYLVYRRRGAAHADHAAVPVAKGTEESRSDRPVTA